jgi:hypothetical protein
MPASIVNQDYSDKENDYSDDNVLLSVADSPGLDISGINWLQGLKEDEWYKIDNGEQGIAKVEWLFDSIINQARIQMDLEYDGGAFEKVLRKYIFYFHPEYEYWFPPEPDFDKGLGNPIEEQIEKQVKWPVWVKKKKVPEGKPYDEYYVIHLGRKYDDERDIYIKFKDGKLYDFKVMRWRELPEVRGLPKIEELKMTFDTDRAEFTRTYYNDNRKWEVYKTDTLMEFGDGNPNPVNGAVDGDGSIDGEPVLEISGVKLLFNEKKFPVDDWEDASDERGFLIFRSLINLCKLQFGLTEDGGEFEKYLRKDFFYYYPWEPWYESVDVWRKPPEDKFQTFKLDVGSHYTHQRDIFIEFYKGDHSIFNDWDWGISAITLERYLRDSGNPPKTEQLMLTFDFEHNYRTAKYIYTVLNPDGTIYSQETKIFNYGNPNSID